MRVFAYCQNCTIAKPDIGGPQLRHRAAFLHPGSNAFRYSKKVIAALPQEKFASYRLLHEFRNFSVKPRWCPIVKHRQNVRKRLFHKLTMEMPIEVTPGQRLVISFVSAANSSVSFRDKCEQKFGLAPL